ncbi:ABC transporter permease [Olivibacter sp. SDN3]|uniref:ABC transporter permease n=1 Tax=Olivibacter sp. SDN3 TaxID=2764720 RepID=UPI001651A2A8|nr:ABC transporter permease [Olivibacter sp. SDN3]QNL47982.1 ABC transporter permease [Olivibacter sp. SDN3]
MNICYVAWRNIIHNFSTSLLGMLLSAVGTAILCLVMLLSVQMDKQLALSSKNIDLVLGAKGSPLQLILNSIYHVDYPTGNINFEEAQKVAANPMVKMAVPLSMGDNYQGFRIIGTDSSFLALYQMELREGRWVSKEFEAVIGAHVASEKKIGIGDRIVGAHGLSSNEDLHDDHPYTIVGILHKSNAVRDNLVLTNLSSVWHMHSHEHQHEKTDHTHGHGTTQHRQKENGEHGEETVQSLVSLEDQSEQITSMLIQYKSPSAVAMFPRMVNQNTNMQAASPYIESARLFSIMGVGLNALQMLATILMFMAALSVFIGLYNAFKNRKYELAVMRVMGGSATEIFTMMIAEGILITFLGTLSGIILAHIASYFIASVGQDNVLSASYVDIFEFWLLLIGMMIGFIASLIPAFSAYTTAISTTLSE